ncbi:DUF6263 family protein [Roseivirga sp. E12]|uniref:DUF6263 family protein n=1 Tax=Roseivirga sp. E12 TaxID=2819237 RepID=UPI001ABC6463|nr:DUF6263 family protein [Roseivirga sp. E12]MBO3700020.1 hypothetical protein [Roseivirga sp. E12]
MKRLRIVLVALMISTIGAYAQKPTGYNLKKGDVFIMTANIKQDIEQEVQGQSLSTDQTLINSDRLEVLAVNGDVYTIKITGIRRAVNLRSPMGSTDMDSDKDDAANMPLRIMNGKSYTVEMNRLGKVLNVAGGSEMREAMKSEFSNAGMGAIADQMLASLTDDLLMNSMTSQMGIYDEVKGDNWTVATASVVNNIPVELVNNFRWDDDKTILAEAKIDMNGTMETMGTQVKSAMAGDQQTIIDLDVATGMPTKVQAVQTVKGNIEAQGLTIPMTIVSETTTTIVKQ